MNITVKLVSSDHSADWQKSVAYWDGRLMKVEEKGIYNIWMHLRMISGEK